MVISLALDDLLDPMLLINEAFLGEPLDESVSCCFPLPSAASDKSSMNESSFGIARLLLASVYADVLLLYT